LRIEQVAFCQIVRELKKAIAISTNRRPVGVGLDYRCRVLHCYRMLREVKESKVVLGIADHHQVMCGQAELTQHLPHTERLVHLHRCNDQRSVVGDDLVFEA